MIARVSGGSAGEYRRRKVSVVDLFLLLLVLTTASYVDQFVYAQGGPPPIVFQSFVLVCFCGIILIRAAFGVRVWSERSARYKSILAALAGLLAWTLIAYAYGSQSEIATDLLIGRFKFALFVVLFAYLLDHAVVRRPFFVGCALLAAGAAVLNIQDFLSPTFSTVPGRAAGLYMNPNVSGFMIVCLGILGMRGLTTLPRYLLWSLVCIGVVLTFSRASWLYLIAGSVVLSWLGYFGFGRWRYAFAIAVVVVLGLLGWMLISGVLYEVVADSRFASSLDVNTLARIGSGGAIFDDFAADERREVVALGLERFQSSPFFGFGLGATYEWEARASTHNMYVLFLAEGGLLGFSLYCIFLLLLIRGTRDIGWLLVLVVIMAGFSTHNLLDSFGEMVVLSAIVAIGALSRQRAG